MGCTVHFWLLEWWNMTSFYRHGHVVCSGNFQKVPKSSSAHLTISVMESIWQTDDRASSVGVVPTPVGHRQLQSDVFQRWLPHHPLWWKDSESNHAQLSICWTGLAAPRLARGAIWTRHFPFVWSRSRTAASVWGGVIYQRHTGQRSFVTLSEILSVDEDTFLKLDGQDLCTSATLVLGWKRSSMGGTCSLVHWVELPRDIVAETGKECSRSLKSRCKRRGCSQLYLGGQVRGLEEYQESELDVSTDFPLLSRQLQPPSTHPQEIPSGRKSGICLPIISLKRVLECCKGENTVHVDAADVCFRDIL